VREDALTGAEDEDPVVCTLQNALTPRDISDNFRTALYMPLASCSEKTNQ